MRYVSEERDEKSEDVNLSEVFLTEEVEESQMIIGSGAPENIAGKEWMEKYLDQMSFDESQIKRKKNKNKKFKFGPSKIYESKDAIEIPIIVKGEEKGTEQNMLRMWGST